MGFSPPEALDVSQLFFQTILHNINTSFSTGQMIGIVGPNGAGKSTFIRLVAGIWKPTTGSVTLNGISVSTLSAKERARQMAYLPQQISEDCPFTVHEFVEMGRYAHHSIWHSLTNSGQKAVQQAILQMGLEKYADVPIGELSGGERQRVGIARCLAQESRILLLDEPISNLDIFYQIDILERLQELANSGYLIILSIHHLEFAARYCAQLLLLKDGTLYAQGKPDAVLTEAAMEDVFSVKANAYRDPFGHFVRFSYRQLTAADELDYSYKNQLR
jgi:ABC-type cobalamin/Fe3+-siderophores transport system ATPase subunit